MSVHPNMDQFQQLQTACDSSRLALTQQAAGGTLTNEVAKRILTTAALYEKHARRLSSRFRQLHIEPLAMMTTAQWKSLRSVFSLYTLRCNKNGYIRVPVPQNWVVKFDVATEYHINRGEIRRFAKPSVAGIAAAEAMTQEGLLRFLMPGNESLSHSKTYGGTAMTLKVWLPPKPDRVTKKLQRLQAAGVHFETTADNTAINFGTSAAEQMRSGAEKIDQAALYWKKNDPLFTVTQGEATAIIEQHGDCPFEKAAIEAHLNGSFGAAQIQ